MEIESEHKKLVEIVNEILSDGFSLSVGDGETLFLKPTTDKKKIIEHASSVDEVYLWLHKDGKPSGTIFLVFGNGPDELIADHSDSVEKYCRDPNTIDTAQEDESTTGPN